MAILTTPEECLNKLLSILDNIYDTIYEIKPEYIELADEILTTISTIIPSETCLKEPYKPISEERLESIVITEFVGYFFSKLIEKEQDIRGLIKPFIEEIIATGLDISIALKYSYISPETIIELITEASKVEEVPLTDIDYIISYAKENAKDKREFSAYLLLIYFYLSEYKSIPSDLIEDIGYYLNKLSVLYQHRVLVGLSLPTLLKAVNQSTELLIPYILYYLMTTNNEKLLDKLYQLITIDILHKKFLDTLHEYNIITDEEYVDNIIYMIHIQSILKDLSIFEYIDKLIKLKIKEEESLILDKLPKSIRDKVKKSKSTLRRELSILYISLYDKVETTKNIIKYLLYTYIKLIKYSTITEIREETIRTIYPFRKTIPYPLLQYVISTIHNMLPSIQPKL